MLRLAVLALLAVLPVNGTIALAGGAGHWWRVARVRGGSAGAMFDVMPPTLLFAGVLTSGEYLVENLGRGACAGARGITTNRTGFCAEARGMPSLWRKGRRVHRQTPQTTAEPADFASPPLPIAPQTSSWASTTAPARRAPRASRAARAWAPACAPPPPPTRGPPSP